MAMLNNQMVNTLWWIDVLGYMMLMDVDGNIW